MIQANVKLACSKCGHIITKKDLEYWMCSKCGTTFKVEFVDKKVKNETKQKDIRERSN